MSNMENLNDQLSEKERQNAVYKSALNAIKSHEIRQSAQGYAVMSAALGYGEGALSDRAFGRISHAAQLFCIGFAFLVPSLLIWRVLL